MKDTTIHTPQKTPWWAPGSNRPAPLPSPTRTEEEKWWAARNDERRQTGPLDGGFW